MANKCGLVTLTLLGFQGVRVLKNQLQRHSMASRCVGDHVLRQLGSIQACERSSFIHNG